MTFDRDPVRIEIRDIRLLFSINATKRNGFYFPGKHKDTLE